MASLLLLAGMLGLPAGATSTCSGPLVQGEGERPQAWDEFATGIWLAHEVGVNVRAHARSDRRGFFPIMASSVPIEEIESQWSPRAEVAFRDEVMQVFAGSGEFRWPHHPTNCDQRAPFYFLPRTPWNDAHVTGSRSTVVKTDGATRFLSIKLPNGEEPLKVQVGGDIQNSLAWEQWFFEVDQHLPSISTKHVLIHDVVGFREKKTGNGILVRDIRPITTNVPVGQFWIPAFSVGVKFPNQRIALELQVADINAMMILRYGFWPSSPHDQQYLVLVDPQSGLLVGRIAIRDLGDGHMYGPVFLALNQMEMLKREAKAGQLKWDTKYLARRNLVPGQRDLPFQLLREAIFRHLGVEDPGGELHAAMLSPLGQAAIRRYHELAQTLLPARYP